MSQQTPQGTLGAARFRAPPPHVDIPRNLSYISGLYEKAYREGGAPGRGRQDWGARPPEGSRRRARSLPPSAERGRLPPGRSRSPDTRKRVRFADSLGLELTSVRSFSRWDAPRVPAHVRAQLQQDALRQIGAGHRGLAFKDPGLAQPLEPTFANPISSADFVQRVRTDKVCLEGVEVERFRLRGTVRVLNVAFSKEVTVRHTADDWLSCTDTPARYIPGSADAHTDRFAFELALPPYLTGRGLQLAIRYRVGLETYWDSDGGRNYRLRPTPSASGHSAPPNDCGSGWVHFV
ncbi:protein phosphatase 1 regulatory subunit 3E-like [Narcine bancroftii]|uniref:protein phosphatase 1 regulatory subunit 3E-like n=1 Tax=Narcine bancroftii TaxID=1343680 RepID=UPI003831A147